MQFEQREISVLISSRYCGKWHCYFEGNLEAKSGKSSLTFRSGRVHIYAIVDFCDKISISFAGYYYTGLETNFWMNLITNWESDVQIVYTLPHAKLISPVPFQLRKVKQS